VADTNASEAVHESKKANILVAEAIAIARNANVTSLVAATISMVALAVAIFRR
jgi:hypothetical protein